MTTVLFLLLLLLSSQLSWGFRFPYIGIGEQSKQRQIQGLFEDSLTNTEKQA